MPKINKTIKYLIITALLLAGVLGTILMVLTDKPKQPQWDIERNIRYSFTLENKTAKPMQNIVFKTYSPVIISSTQKLMELNSTHTFTKQPDIYGNQVMEFNIDFIPPYGKKKISITAGLLLSKIVAGTDSKDALFVSEQPLIETNSEAIQKLANNLKSQAGDLQKNIFNWLVDNIEYSGYGMRDKGALYAIQELQGDCTEYAYLNVALNRVLGFKSRAVNGYVVTHDKKLAASGFHTWSEIWLDNGWQVIDAQKKALLENQENYIAMNIVVDTNKSNKAFKRFWVSTPDLIVTMK